MIGAVLRGLVNWCHGQAIVNRFINSLVERCAGRTASNACPPVSLCQSDLSQMN
jgi:hypothetical protein